MTSTLPIHSKTCELCGAEFAVTNDKAEERRFCSRQCFGLFRTMQAKKCPFKAAYERELDRLNERIARWRHENETMRLKLLELPEKP